MQIQKEVVHYPTLKTILAIEDVVKKANTPVSRNQILARLPTGVMRSTLNLALDYMEKRGMILETKKGFVWTFNPSKKLEKAEEEGLPIAPITTRDIILETLERNQSRINKFGVKRLGLFGSYARNEQRPGSDIDMLVEFSDGMKTFNNYMGLKLFLEGVFKNKVDLVMKDTIRPELKESILSSVVYA